MIPLHNRAGRCIEVILPNLHVLAIERPPVLTELAVEQLVALPNGKAVVEVEPQTGCIPPLEGWRRSGSARSSFPC
jgi:hypothetical protein